LSKYDENDEPLELDFDEWYSFMLKSGNIFNAIKGIRCDEPVYFLGDIKLI